MKNQLEYFRLNDVECMFREKKSSLEAESRHVEMIDKDYGETPDLYKRPPSTFVVFISSQQRITGPVSVTAPIRYPLCAVL